MRMAEHIKALAMLGFKKTSPPFAPSIHITGSTFSTAQVLPGLPGGRDDATHPTRTYMAASSTANLVGGSLWSATIRGTGAAITLGNTASPANAVLVSVDGGAFAPAAYSGTNPLYTYTLFTGLSDTVHHVVFRIGLAWGTTAVYFDKTLTSALQVTAGKTEPYVEICNQWCYAGVPNDLSLVSGMVKNSAANYTPAKTKQSIFPGVSNISSARIRGKFTSLRVAVTGSDGLTAVYVSKNGAAPIKYAVTDPGVGGTVVMIAGFEPTTATYTIWCNHLEQAMFAVSGDGDHVDIGAKQSLHQFGDSITWGGSSAPVFGEVDTLRVAAAMGYAACTAGVGGHSIAQCKTALDTYLPALSVSSADVAVLAIGRNNVSSDTEAFLAEEIADYISCIDKLVAKGYGKVICRGVIPRGDLTIMFTQANADIANIVSGYGNAAVVFCGMAGVPAYSTQANDKTHPDAAGYGVVANYVEARYRTILGVG